MVGLSDRERRDGRDTQCMEGVKLCKNNLWERVKEKDHLGDLVLIGKLI